MILKFPKIIIIWVFLIIFSISVYADTTYKWMPSYDIDMRWIFNIFNASNMTVEEIDVSNNLTATGVCIGIDCRDEWPSGAYDDASINVSISDLGISVSANESERLIDNTSIDNRLVIVESNNASLTTLWSDFTSYLADAILNSTLIQRISNDLDLNSTKILTIEDKVSTLENDTQLNATEQLFIRNDLYSNSSMVDNLTSDFQKNATLLDSIGNDAVLNSTQQLEIIINNQANATLLDEGLSNLQSNASKIEDLGIAMINNESERINDNNTLTDLIYSRPSDTNTSTICGDGEVSMGDDSGLCLNLNETIDIKTAVTYFNATFIDIIRGTNNSDDLSLIWEYDLATYNISEATGSPAMDVRVNFTNVIDFNQLTIRMKTTDGGSHRYKIQIYDYVKNGWEDYTNFVEVDTFKIMDLGVYDADEHISNGLVSVRFYLDETGNPSHEVFLDWVILSKGPATFSTNEIDPLSHHKGENIELNGYNITDINVINITGIIYGIINNIELNINSLIETIISNAQLNATLLDRVSLDLDKNATKIDSIGNDAVLNSTKLERIESDANLNATEQERIRVNLDNNASKLENVNTTDNIGGIINITGIHCSIVAGEDVCVDADTIFDDASINVTIAENNNSLTNAWLNFANYFQFTGLISELTDDLNIINDAIANSTERINDNTTLTNMINAVDTYDDASINVTVNNQGLTITANESQRIADNTTLTGMIGAGSYNATYDLYAYNQTQPAMDYADENDADTTYTAGSNITLTGTEFSLNVTAVKEWLDNIYQAIGTYLTEAQIDTKIEEANNSMKSYVDTQDSLQDECSEISGCVENAITSYTDTNATTECGDTQLLRGDGTCVEESSYTDTNESARVDPLISDSIKNSTSLESLKSDSVLNSTERLIDNNSINARLVITEDNNNSLTDLWAKTLSLISDSILNSTLIQRISGDLDKNSTLLTSLASDSVLNSTSLEALKTDSRLNSTLLVSVASDSVLNSTERLIDNTSIDNRIKGLEQSNTTTTTQQLLNYTVIELYSANFTSNITAGQGIIFDSANRKGRCEYNGSCFICYGETSWGAIC